MASKAEVSEAFAIPVVAFGLIGYMAAGAALNGLAISFLWGWFVAPTFGLPHISVPVGIGLGMLRANYRPADKDESPTMRALTPFIYPVLTISLGWLVHLFV